MVGRANQRTYEQSGLAIRLSQDELTVPIESVKGVQMGLPFHRSKPDRSITILLRNLEERARRIKVTFECDGRPWKSRWAQWEIVPMSVSESMGGEDLAHYDQVNRRWPECELLLPPLRNGVQEWRQLWLCINPILEQGAQNASLEYKIIVTEEGESGAHLAMPGVAHVVHQSPAALAQLPAIYRELDGIGPHAPFFHRFLAGFQSEFDCLGRVIGQSKEVFGPYTTPSVFLAWLSQWVCLSLDGSWSEMALRKLIQRAVVLHRLRGTKEGLSLLLETYCGSRPVIHDRPVDGARLKSNLKLGSPGAKLGALREHMFTVTLAVPDGHPINEDVIRQMIHAYKPAHTAFVLRIVRKAPGDKWTTISTAHEDSGEFEHAN